MDWSRHRTLGIDLLLVGVLVLLVAAGFAFDTVCSGAGACTTDVNWPALVPAIALIAAGAFFLVMARRARAKSP